MRNPNGQIKLYCKGADTILYERLHVSSEELMYITSEHLNVSMPSVTKVGWLFSFVLHFIAGSYQSV